METTEKIIESYVRYVRRWATIPNVKGFSRLTAKPFDPGDPKFHLATARRTLGYFRHRKFAADGDACGSKEIRSRLLDYGFRPGEYHKVIVTWGWTEDAKREADAASIELWDFRNVVRAIAAAVKDQTSYFGDDTLRTIGLYIKARHDVNSEG